MKSIQRSRGFTLIELLVVIAIIGILASVVLASLNTARDKGNDAKVKAQISNIKSSAAVYYDNQDPKSYGNATTDCATEMFVDTTSGLAEYTNTANYPNGTVLTCVSDGLAYAVMASLNDGTEWCADSEGASGQITADPALVAATDVSCALMDATE